MNYQSLIKVAAILCCGASIALPVQASFIGGSQITPSTTLASIGGFTIDQIADTITNEPPKLSPFNGFASDSDSGTIKLGLDQAYNLNGFRLWNDINVLHEGIAHFRLDFFDSAMGLIISSSSFLGPNGLLAPATFSFTPVNGVRSVDLVVLTSNAGVFNRIEIREVGFLAVPEPASFALAASAITALLGSRLRRARRRTSV